MTAINVSSNNAQLTNYRSATPEPLEMAKAKGREVLPQADQIVDMAKHAPALQLQGQISAVESKRYDAETGPSLKLLDVVSGLSPSQRVELVGELQQLSQGGSGGELLKQVAGDLPSQRQQVGGELDQLLEHKLPAVEKEARESRGFSFDLIFTLLNDLKKLLGNAATVRSDQAAKSAESS